MEEYFIAAISAMAAVIGALATAVVTLFRMLQRRNDQLVELALTGNNNEILEKIIEFLQATGTRKRRKKSDA